MANERPAETKKKPGGKRSKGGKWKKFILATSITAGVAIICALIGYMVIIYNGQKIYERNQDKMEMMEASIIYDANDQEVATLATENRELVEPKDIPLLVKEAFIATEDRRFEEHNGVDPLGIGRAIVKDIVKRSAVEGGSTITQQLAKNMFLNSDKTFFRKGTEMSIALALENNMTKDEILTMYLNRIFFGNRAFGIKAASKVYFGKSDLNSLTLAEAATLAAVPKAPSVYNPISNPEKSKERRNTVLRLMAEQGYITEDEKVKAQAEEYVRPPVKSKEFTVFTDYVLQELEDQYKLPEDKILRGGYKIYTTMNPDAQRIVESSFNNPKLFQADGPQQKMQGSMVILNNKDGGIIAMSGGRDYVNKGLNRATIQRQPGSTFKPLIVYAPAIEKGPYNPYSKLKDEAAEYNGYSPRNYDGVYKGEVDMFDAVRRSVNAPAVWLLNEIGIPYATKFVNNMGIPLDKEKDRNLAIALGGLTKGVTPLQMAQAYSAFPDNGQMYTAHAVRRIIDGDGNKTEVKLVRTKVMSPKTAYYMTQLMRGVVEGGTGSAARMNRPVAGKTGTTQLDLKGLEKNNRDIWFAGYTPEWTAAVWMGFDKTDTKHYVLNKSGSMPAAMFKEVMTKAMAKMPVKDFVKPDSVDDLTAPPKAVSSLSAEYVPEKKQVVLKWSGDADNAVGAYQVYRKESKESDFQLIIESVKGTFEASDLSVVPGDTYEYYVVPYNIQSAQAGDKSNVVSVAIPTAEQASPSPSPGEASASPDPAGSGKPGESAKPGASATPKPGASGGKSPAPGNGAPAQPSGSPKASAAPGGDAPGAGGGAKQPGASAPAGGNGGGTDVGADPGAAAGETASGQPVDGAAQGQSAGEVDNP